MPEQKIRGENPPQIRIEELKTYDTRYQSFQTLFYGGTIIIGVAELLAALAGAYWLVVIFIIIAVSMRTPLVSDLSVLQVLLIV